MTDEAQIYFNVAVAVFGGLGGWILNNLKDSLKSLHESDAALTKQVQSIELLVAGKYVTTDSLEKITNALFAKLDKIDAKLDTKADRDQCTIHHKP